ncbi:hypothetical protein RSAG8_06190, partial [Rhizoctonia solani AG-8 WAC10335]
MKDAGYFLKMGRGGSTFDWLRFKCAIHDHSDITVEEFNEENIDQPELNVNSMINKIMDVLLSFAPSATRPGAKDAIATKLINTFTNPSRQETSGFLEFCSESHGTGIPTPPTHTESRVPFPMSRSSPNLTMKLKCTKDFVAGGKPRDKNLLDLAREAVGLGSFMVAN